MQKTILRSGVAAVAVAIAAFLCHALTLIPDHPKGEGQPDAIVNWRNSELILEQPAEMRRTEGECRRPRAQWTAAL